MMRFWIVKDGKLVEYERMGECRRCGQCCCSKVITFALGVYTEDTLDDNMETDDKDWSGYEGFSVFRSQGLLWYIEATTKQEEKICGDFEKGACTLWMQDDFPAICRYWPVHPDNLIYFPDCGFSFRKA